MAYKRSRQSFEADLQKQSSPFVLYGTPLPPLDDHTRDDGSFVPVWKQEVTDERGRKRLHGAFTGGFSAGYFNTVGSKDGWTPSTFVSSRQNRAKDSKGQQRPEDFMDDEDLQEAEESRNLQTSTEFAGFGTEHDPRRMTATVGLFRPSEQTVGVRLLTRMGWKEGQGIGPRIRRAANLGDSDDEHGDEHMFAPDDVQIVSYFRKTDHKGLGYDGELQDITVPAPRASAQKARSSLPEDSSEEEGNGPRLFKAKKPTDQKPKAAFGVGVLNDGDSDDEDPYSMGPRISYNRVIGGDRKPKTKPKLVSASANPLLKKKPTFVSKRLGSLKGALRKCHDGRLPPDGFVLADDLEAFGSMTIKDEKYRPQEVPSNWQSSKIAEPTESATRFVSTADAAKASSLNSKSRATLLGETQLPGKSVFDFMTPAARDRLATASGKDNLPAARSENAPTGYEKAKSATESLQNIIPQLERDVALQALNRGAGGWMPYAEDESKRNRYRIYLEFQADLRQNEEGGEIPQKPDGMKHEDWLLEMQEFARAAHVFKPVSGLMASRFTSSTNMPQAHDGTATDSLLSRPSAKPEDPAESAAKLGMFGPMTRSFSNFYPTRLICKRFSLPPPDHSTSATSSARDGSFNGEMSRTVQMQFNSVGSADSHQDESIEVVDPPQGKKETTAPVLQSLKSGLIVGSSLPALDPDRNEALEQDRPGQAVFKAIFGSDDEDD